MKRLGFTQPHFPHDPAAGQFRFFMLTLFSGTLRDRKSRAGFTLTESLIIGTVFGLVLIVGSVVLGSERARTRDAKRIADMTRLASGFALLFAEKASYAPAAAGCPKVGDLAANCTFPAPLTGSDAVADPGRFSYTVSHVPDKDNFGIEFRLERTYGSLRPGLHTLSKIGIQ